MKRLTRKINARLLKKLSTLTGVTLIWLLLYLLLQPFVMLTSQIVYFALSIKVLIRMWDEALKYEGSLIVV